MSKPLLGFLLLLIIIGLRAIKDLFTKRNIRNIETGLFSIPADYLFTYYLHYQHPKLSYCFSFNECPVQVSFAFLLLLGLLLFCPCLQFSIG